MRVLQLTNACLWSVQAACYMPPRPSQGWQHGHTLATPQPTHPLLPYIHDAASTKSATATAHTHLLTLGMSSLSLITLPSLASSTASVWPTAFFLRNFFRPDDGMMRQAVEGQRKGVGAFADVRHRAGALHSCHATGKAALAGCRCGTVAQLLC